MISVILTCHNEERFIERAVQSVSAQTASQAIADIIVVNDGSTDSSASILARLSAQLPHLKVITAGGVGLPAARNLAIREASGDWIAILDGDDYWAPDKIERQLTALRDPRVGVVYSDWYDFTAFDGTNAKFVKVRVYNSDDTRTLEEYFVHDAPIVPSTALIRRAAFDDVGLFDENVRLGEDTEMFLRLAERWRFQHVPAGLAYKRRHDANLTRSLEGLLPVAEMLTDRFAARNPQLQRLSFRRMARRYAATGNDCANRGETRKALSYLGGAIQRDPLFWRSWLYLALALVPGNMSRKLREFAKSLFHGRIRRRAPS